MKRLINGSLSDREIYGPSDLSRELIDGIAIDSDGDPDRHPRVRNRVCYRQRAQLRYADGHGWNHLSMTDERHLRWSGLMHRFSWRTILCFVYRFQVSQWFIGEHPSHGQSGYRIPVRLRGCPVRLKIFPVLLHREFPILSAHFQYLADLKLAKSRPGFTLFPVLSLLSANFRARPVRPGLRRAPDSPK